jgi:hypothetical protein
MVSYEVCYMSSLGLLTIVFYKTLEDYDSEKPAIIYVIAPRRSKKEALEKARILERRFPEIEIKVLYEGKDKERIDKVLDACLKANQIMSPSIW